jgi:hypothetical protein
MYLGLNFTWFSDCQHAAVIFLELSQSKGQVDTASMHHAARASTTNAPFSHRSLRMETKSALVAHVIHITLAP